MEGLLDHPLREILTAVGGIDRCVSEFIRITDMLMPDRVFTRIVPELLQGGRTRAGVPVRPQLLGSDPACMADNAAALAAFRPDGIDLNFGCPAKVVNRHGGGASLLQDPALLGRIVEAVRRAVPAALPVSAKMRLGYEDASLARECAQALAGGGASELVVHARTKADGYRPPAYWERVPAIREAVAIPVIANGEIWTPEDAERCRRVSGCDGLMLGRGMVADPGLARAIRASRRAGHVPSTALPRHATEAPLDARGYVKASAGGPQSPADYGAPPAVAWEDLLPQLAEFWRLVSARVEPRHRAGRLKQWLNLLRRRYPQAQRAYDELRLVNDPAALGAAMFANVRAIPLHSLEMP
ncbi:tRNA dihydrouridine synthase [Scleromatobacter humisilvae]|uniref:tRNA-dihydrouridine(16) synthase n=1 Tax=Scleromatobacter humisilvae TaxID=2897159 RepID=A0A9X1YEU9_9BURK|nr:tRNA-dihydrouridine synthase family protein [Scleromatobacter humisilvae]MCK9684312.1 tRNA-dihydrouridine synthase family protein [Scleromatobacter humisilvae]